MKLEILLPTTQKQKKIVREYEHLYDKKKKMNSIDEMNKFLERYKLPILTQEEIENLNRPIRSKEIESIKKNLPVKRSPEPDGFTEVLYSLKEESALIFSPTAPK